MRVHLSASTVSPVGNLTNPKLSVRIIIIYDSNEKIQ